MPSLSPAFRRLASSNLAAHSEQIALAAAPLAAVLALGADAAQTGYLQTAQTLPSAVAARRVLADRMQRRLLMSAAECARAVSLLCLLALLWSGQLTRCCWPRWLPGRSRHRRLRGRPRAGAPAGAPGRLAGANRWRNWRAPPSAVGRRRWSARWRVRRLCVATALSLLAALLLAGLPPTRCRDGGTPPSDAS